MFKRVSILLISMMFIFGISKLSFAMIYASDGHGKYQQIAQSETTSATAKGAVNVGNKICPVSGDKINEKMKATYEYKGKIYNFCCASCIEEFKKDPGKYIQKIEEEKRKAEEKTR